METSALELLWVLPGESAREDVTELGRLAPHLGAEVLLRLQRPNVSIVDSTLDPPRIFLANDHCKAAAGYLSPLSGRWFREDGRLLTDDEIPAGALRYEETSKTKSCRLLLQDLVKAYFQTRFPIAIHSEYLWELKENRGLGLAVLSRAEWALPDHAGLKQMKCQVDVIQSMTICLGLSTLYQVKTLAYMTLGAAGSADIKCTAKIVDHFEDAEYFHRQTRDEIILATAAGHLETGLAVAFDVAFKRVPKLALRDLNTLRIYRH